MIAGSAPGSEANTTFLGTGMLGTAATGSSVKASAPASSTPIASKVVPIGRRMNRAEKFTAYSAGLLSAGAASRRAAQPSSAR